MSVEPVPDGYHTVTPYLIVEHVPELVAFLERAFGARASGLLERPDGSVMHAEVRIGDSAVMMGEPMGEFGPMPASLFLYGGVLDSMDNIWWIATHVEDVSWEEQARRIEAGAESQALEVRKATPEKSLRITWEDGSSVEVYFYAKGDGRSQVALQQRKLPSKKAAEAAKAFWSERLDALAELVAGG